LILIVFSFLLPDSITASFFPGANSRLFASIHSSILLTDCLIICSSVFLSLLVAISAKSSAYATISIPGGTSTLGPVRSSDLAFVSDGRDSSSVLSDRQGDCLVFVVLCSVPVPRPVFSTRSARFAYICAVLRSSPANRPHNSLQRGPHWRKCRSSAFSSIHLKDPVLLHHKL
jgi:hypothetical protein